MAVASSSAPEVNYRIGTLMAVFIVAVAAIFDAVGFLLMLTGIGAIATEIIGIVGSIFFFFLFLFLRVSFFSGKASAKLGIIGAGSVVEIIPFVNGISPTFTIETTALIHLTRKEDREKAKKEHKERVEKTALAQQQTDNMIAQYVSRKGQRVQEAANDNEGGEGFRQAA